MKNPSPVGDELFHADGQTDRTKLIVTFQSFVNMPKNTAHKENRKRIVNLFTSGKTRIIFVILYELKSYELNIK
jgi:hypothetical protein